MTERAAVDSATITQLEELREVLLAHDDPALLRDLLAERPGGHDAALALIVGGMAQAFRPDRSDGETGVVRFEIGTDSGVRTFALDVREDECVVLAEPDAGYRVDTVVTAGIEVFLRIAFGLTTGADSYIDGLVHATGDVVLATGFDDWFDLDDVLVHARIDAGGHR